MKKYPKILLPTNLSQSACDAADFIIALLGRNAEYELLNSFPLVYRSGFYDSFQNYKPEYDEIPIEKLKRERNRLIKKFGNQSIEIKAMYGDPVSDLIKTAENHADLVVMGEEQFTGWSFQRISKVKTSMIHLEIPLIFVPNIESFDKVKTVILIQDCSRSQNTESMDLLRQLCEVSGVNFQVILVNDSNTSNEQPAINTQFNIVRESEEVKVISDRNELEKMLQNKVDSQTILVSTIEHEDTRLSEIIQKLFEDDAIVHTKLLMPKKSIENFLRGA